VLRIAVCLSGHMRSFAATAKTLFENLAPPGESPGILADYYIHTWSSLGAGEAGWDARQSDVLDVGQMCSLYCPAAVCVERYNPESWPARSMFRKIKLCHRMAVESNREYDVYVRARPDSFFVRPVVIPSPLSKGVLYVPDRASFGGTCDQFALGDRSAMDRYSSMIDAQSRDDHFHPETRLKSYLTCCTVDTVDVAFKIMRSDGSLYDTMCLG
jgi:hypothetical protein